MWTKLRHNKVYQASGIVCGFIGGVGGTKMFVKDYRSCNSYSYDNTMEHYHNPLHKRVRFREIYAGVEGTFWGTLGGVIVGILNPIIIPFAIYAGLCRAVVLAAENRADS